MRIVAAIVEEPGGAFVLDEVELDEPRADELVIRNVAVGLCHTDLSVRSGATPFPLPAVAGHEGAGIVEAVGSSSTGFELGDHVLLSYSSCGHCDNCRSNRPVYCVDWLPMNLLGGSRLDGTATLRRGSEPLHGHFFGQSSFASHSLVNARSAVKVTPDLSLITAAPLGCSVQTGAGAVFNLARPEPGSTLVVFGAGGVGLIAVMAATLTPVARIVAVDVNSARLALAQEMGATDVINSAESDAVAGVRDLCGGGATYAIETSGRPAVLDQAIQSLTAAGTCVVIGAPPLGTRVPIDVPNLLGRGLRILGTNQGDSVPTQFLPRLVALHRAGRLPFDRLIRQYAFDDINQAAADAASGATIKPVLVLP